jgi:phosphoribosylformylglycinamidine (FGAM) synthase-like enzyme
LITTERGSCHFYRAFASRFTDPVSGSRTAIAEALSNIVWAPIKGGFDGISLSANWMWACKTKEKMLVCTLP